jgi:3-oxoacyl-[acyl-carrier protein] reductase
MLNNKPVALVTGASRGIGRAIALRLADDGYHVVINSRTADPDNLTKGAYEVKKKIEDAGGSATILRADISSAKERQRMISFIDNDIKRVDLLVNNAGIEPEPLDMLETTEERFDQVFETNLKGPYFLTQQIAKRMITWKKKSIAPTPRIVFITSVQAYMPTDHGVEYCMTKASLHMAMQAYAIRLGEYGINAYEISPGVIVSDMTSVHTDSINKMISDGKMVTKRWGQPEEIAALVSTIARGDLDYSTGSRIEVGGGLGLRRL